MSFTCNTCLHAAIFLEFENKIYNGPSVIRTPIIRSPMWSGQFWANYSPLFPTAIIITFHYYRYHHKTVKCTISSLREFYFSTECWFLYVTCTAKFTPGGPDSVVIQTTPPPIQSGLPTDHCIIDQTRLNIDVLCHAFADLYNTTAAYTLGSKCCSSSGRAVRVMTATCLCEYSYNTVIYWGRPPLFAGVCFEDLREKRKSANNLPSPAKTMF
jgi:hypothetical protein